MKSASSGKSCLLFGTFDVRNYGDLLFPLIAARRLAHLDITVVPVSPTPNSVGFGDAMTPIDVEAALRSSRSAQAVLLGGGNIIHNRQARISDYSTAEGLANTAYTSLWLGSALCAAIGDIPLAWNAPGVPQRFVRKRETMLLHRVVAATNYCSVRDKASRAHLDTTSSLVHVVPDTALDVYRLWPREQLAPIVCKLLTDNGKNPHSHTLAIHVKRRSVAEPLQILADRIDTLAMTRQLVPILVALGDCHGDAVMARELSSCMRCDHIVQDAPATLQAIAATIACSELFIGASLHGFITALAYGTAARLVGKPSLVKFEGFALQLGCQSLVADSWVQALDSERAASPGLPDHLARKVVSAHKALDRHWLAIALALASRQSRRSARNKLLRHLWLTGAQNCGMTWAMLPFLAVTKPLARRI
jgi:polysaccharide pyruvyl transferase WcaK-like protein